MMKKKIAVIGLKGLPAYGGAARANEEILKRLCHKYDFTIFEISTHSSKIPLDRDLKAERIVFKGWKSKRINTSIYYLKSLFYCLFKSNYDLIHTQHLYSGFIIPLLKLKYKVLNSTRGIVPANDNKWNKIDKIFFRIFEKLALEFSDAVVSVSKPQITYLNKISAKKIYYIPNGVNVENKSDNDAQFNPHPKDYLLFSAARIISLKGCHTFFESLNRINYKGDVVVIGDLEQVPEYKKYLLKLSDNLNIKFTGLIKDRNILNTYIKNSKYFIFPSTIEGMSNMLLEVASLNIPVIASDIEENRAIFSEDEVLYFRTNDSYNLSQKIIWALDNENEMKGKASRAYRKLLNEYTWENVSWMYDKLYQDLLS